MLILLDIDATMIKTGGAGIRAMTRAGKELFGPAFTADGVPFAGRLDPLILVEMLGVSGIPATIANLRAIRERYRDRLVDELSSAESRRALPGVLDLLGALRRSHDVALGVLTGNFAETGAMKLKACGIDPDWFHVSVWGDDSPHSPPDREHLPPVARDRYRVRFGRAIEPGRVTIVGDTPHDVRCARANGCRSLGVATGQFAVADLAASGADRAITDLSDTDDVMKWLIGGPDGRP